MDALSKQFRPTPEIAEQFKFHSRVRQAGELIATYVAELRLLSEYCNFDVTLDDMLRDCLVRGMNNGAIQKHLLAQTDLTYKKAVELVLTGADCRDCYLEYAGTRDQTRVSFL